MSINSIIDRFSGDPELYKSLKRFYVRGSITPEKAEDVLEEIKETITKHYLKKYKFSTAGVRELHGDLLQKLNFLCDLTVKVRQKNGRWKIYPVKETDQYKERAYEIIMGQVVDYQIEKNVPLEDAFANFARSIGEEMKDFKQELIDGDMEPFYGSPYYMIERSKFIIECVNNIPGVHYDLDGIRKILTDIGKKLYRGVEEGQENFVEFDVDKRDFYEDYDLIERYYKSLLELENELAPKVVEYWKEYLTDPREHPEEFRYVMHSFSKGMVDPSQMRKACCSLHTRNVDNFMYGTFGLIYDIDADSLDTLCSEDAGSWIIDKEKFVEARCPVYFQYPIPYNGSVVYYENPRISKLIMPEVYERECVRLSGEDENWIYSEIYINNKGRALAVFYTDDCDNIEEVREYAEKYNLPLVHVPVHKERGQKGKKHE